MNRLHIAFAHLGLLIAIATVAGAAAALVRAYKRRMSRDEAALGLLGWGYLFLAWWYGIFIAYEYHGAVKATYSLAAAPILAAWTAQALDAAGGASRWRTALVWILAAAPVALTLFQRVVW